MLGKESKITRTAAWACSWSLETEPQGEWGYRDIRSEWISAWGGRTFHGAAVQRRGAGMFIHGGEGQQALGKIIKTINSLQKVSVTGNAQWTEVIWWDAELRTQMWCCRPVAARPGCVSHELMYLILSREVRTSKPLHHSRAEISCSTVKPRGHTSGWHEVQST